MQSYQGAEERARLCLPQGVQSCDRLSRQQCRKQRQQQRQNAAAETAAAEAPAADTQAQIAQAILGDSTPGVNSKRGQCASPGKNAVRKPKREQGCASPGERAVLRLPLMATGPQAVAAAAATAAAAAAAAAEAPAADTEAQTAQTADPSLALAIIGDSTPGVNFKGGLCTFPGENAVREPKREQGCASPGECAVLFLPLMATVPRAAAAAEAEAQGAAPSLCPTEMEPAQGSEVAAAAAPTAQKADACPATAILGDSTPGVSSKHGRCASPGKSSSETAGTRTQTAPSRRRREQQGLFESTREIRRETYTPWDKIPGIGEAKNPSPEPPRELCLDRKNGQRDPIRLFTQNGGWVWNVHCVPAKRPETGWQNTNLPLNQKALRLPGSWPKHGKNSLSHNHSEKPAVYLPMSLDSSCSGSPPRECNPKQASSSSDSQPPRESAPPNLQTESLPRKRLRGKTPQATPSPAPTELCPAESQDSAGSQSSDGRPEPYGCWDEIYEVL